MRVRVTWVDGRETDMNVSSLRELDSLIGRHSGDGIIADIKPFRVSALHVVFRRPITGSAQAPAGEPHA
jgi:hypothetical protein